ncbi:chromate transporter [Brevibacillus sp. B_LB10_24]|uniref:chromate transporter n=1 Tax=Brevibacillus sp. B_LB10_24 TaxID=3380645 RepID=UPI0038BBEE44
MAKPRNRTTLLRIFVTFFKMSPVTFGGGYAMIPLFEKTVVEEQKWLKKEDIVDVLAVSQAVPGSVAVNSATFIGYRVAGLPGALVAAAGITVPSSGIVIALAALFMGFKDHPYVQSALRGIHSAIVALILLAAIKTLKTSITDKLTFGLAAVSLLTLLFFSLHPIDNLLFGIASGCFLYLKRKYAVKRTGGRGSRHRAALSKHRIEKGS